MIIALASDHAGYALKERLKARLSGQIEFLDLGTDSEQSVDYPDFGRAAAQALQDGRAERAILICGSGIGISIAANRFAFVRAALCVNPEMARLARLHNDANVLALGARLVDEDTAVACVEVFLNTAFEGGRHEGRVKKLGCMT
ncbi:MAG: ribose 5-phosphate isomerase B [Alphaproteobacteria bacterium]|nr:ribose 5-phosphate isomerase B [Alphaproteobacteria bacterium]